MAAVAAEASLVLSGWVHNFIWALVEMGLMLLALLSPQLAFLFRSLLGYFSLGL